MKKLLAFFLLLGVLPSQALEVHFLRHGETVWNRSGVLQGSLAYPDLSPRGVRMAEATAKGLAAAGVRYGKIYASDLRRAFRTAEIIAAKQGVAVTGDSRIREMCFGRYEGVRYGKGEYPDENLRNLFTGEGTYKPAGAGAETLRDVAERVRDFLDKEIRPLEGKVDKVLCVTHSFVIRALVRELSPDVAVKPLLRNCGVHVVKLAGGRFSVAEEGKIFYDAAGFDELPEPLMVAHRGAGDINGYRPESSKAAYSNAVATACDLVKLDLQQTRDKVIVMHHDPTLKRMMAWDVKIVDHDYAEIRDKGVYYGPGHRLDRGTQRIVRLDEALAITRVIPQFWVDFKFFTPEFADGVFRTFTDAGIDFSRIIVATFSTAALEYVKSRYPNVRLVSHINWRWSEKENAFRGSMRTGRMPTRERVLECVVERCQRLGLYGVNMPFSMTTREDVEFLHGNGVKWVSLYFVQNEESAAKVRPWKVDAFVTDHVSEVRKAYDGKCGKSVSAVSDGKRPESIMCEGEYKGHLQGTDARGTNIWWSFTSKIVRTDLAGKVLASCDAPSHQGDLCVKGDTVYVAVNRGRFNTEDKGVSSVYAFDAMTLERKNIWKLDIPHGAGGITWKGERFYVVGGLPPTHERNYVYEYDEGFNLVKRHVLNTGYTVLGIQTATFVDGEFLFGIYGGDANPGGLLRCPADLSSVRRYTGGGAVGFAKINGRMYTASTPSVKTAKRVWTGSLHPADGLLDDANLFSNTWYEKGVFTPQPLRTAKVEIGTGKGGVNFAFGNSWRRRMEALAKAGYNAVFIDLADGFAYPSHPELASKKAWKPAHLRNALKMARESGVEPVPYMDFTSPRNAWLGEKNLPGASPEALKLCTELIGDQVGAYGHARYFRIVTDGLPESAVKALNDAVIANGYGSCPWSMKTAPAGEAVGR